jgi:RNA polymerase sigma-70 factor (ECF subfamily)
MLAKRLTRRGLALTSGSLAVLLTQQAASACAPTAVVATTIKAATLFAAGQAASAGVISTSAAALTEGVLKTMFVTKLKIATVVLLLGVAVAAGTGGTYRALTGEWGAMGAEANPNPAPQGATKGQDADKKTDKDMLQGAWVAESGETGGQKVGQEKVKAVKITFEGDKIEIVGLMQDKGKGTFTLDPTKKPKTIDLRIPGEEDVAGIYEFDGKTFKLCLNTAGMERPKEFTGKGRQILLILKR